MDDVLELRCVINAASLIMMKMNARIIDGPAPVAIVYAPHNVMTAMLLTVRMAFLPPAKANTHVAVP